MTLLGRLRTLASVADGVSRFFRMPAAPAGPDPAAAALLAEADEAYGAGRHEEARSLYQRVLDRRRNDLAGLRGLRRLAVEAGRWREALDLEQRLVVAATATERIEELEWLAVIHHELGRGDARHGDAAGAIAHFKAALKADRHFVPAAVALGDAYCAAGDDREAVRTWERAAEVDPALPLLARLEQAYRTEGRPSRMIALYRAAAGRAPDNLALAVALGRVYFELEMLDEAAEQFERIEVRAPAMPVVHAFLGAIFERRGETRDAFEEYRRAIRLSEGFSWPERCAACGATAAVWEERCPRCRRWNTLRPAPAS